MKKFNRCNNCKNYRPEVATLTSPLTKIEKEIDLNHGSCHSPKFIYGGGSKALVQDDCLTYSDYEGYQADFSVGKDFGCIHHVPVGI